MLPWPVFGVCSRLCSSRCTRFAASWRPIRRGVTGPLVLQAAKPTCRVLASSTGWLTLRCCVLDLSARPLSSAVKARFCWERPSSAPNPSFAGSMAKAPCDWTVKGTGIAPVSGCAVGWSGLTFDALRLSYWRPRIWTPQANCRAMFRSAGPGAPGTAVVALG